MVLPTNYDVIRVIRAGQRGIRPNVLLHDTPQPVLFYGACAVTSYDPSRYNILL